MPERSVLLEKRRNGVRSDSDEDMQQRTRTHFHVQTSNAPLSAGSSALTLRVYTLTTPELMAMLMAMTRLLTSQNRFQRLVESRGLKRLFLCAVQR